MRAPMNGTAEGRWVCIQSRHETHLPLESSLLMIAGTVPGAVGFSAYCSW